MSAVGDRIRGVVAPALAPLQPRINEARSQILAMRDRALDVWNRLTPRDQQIVTWVGAALGTLLLVVTVMLASSHLTKLKHSIETRSKQLAEVREMRGRYSEQKSKLDAINARLRISSGPPRTFLEEKAREANVAGAIDGMRDLAAPPNELFKSQVIEVKLKKVTVANVARYLHKVETTGVGMSVRSLHLEPNFNDAKYLNATIEILSLRPKEE